MRPKTKVIFMGGSGIPEAPIDGSAYARKNAGWVAASGVSYIDGEVATHADLPVTVGTPAVDSVYMVLAASGLWLINRKPAGLYVRTGNGGTLADWTYADAFPDVFSDANFQVYDNADTSKILVLSVGGLTTATTRTLTVQDKDGTIACTNDAAMTDERVPTAAGLTTKFGTNKASIADGDKIALLDSAASDAPKYSLWSLVKSTLKTYFDTLYSPINPVVKIATFSVDGGGSAITTGTVAGTVRVPYACTLTGYSITATAATGTITVKFWVKATGTAIPTIADVINTSGVSLTTGTAVNSTTLTDFSDTSYAAGDMIRCAITAVDSAATDLTVILYGTRN